jgi:hypothetical protein
MKEYKEVNVDKVKEHSKEDNMFFIMICMFFIMIYKTIHKKKYNGEHIKYMKECMFVWIYVCMYSCIMYVLCM